jgi:site-specific DNA-adenine methylase
VRTPAFRHMGGKARLRKWLVEHFPDRGQFYIEPFAGRGNVFFHAVKHLNFQWWELNDLDAKFLYCLRTADLSKLPESVNRDEFLIWKARAADGDPIAQLIEPRITFAGKGYDFGYSGHSGTHVGYTGENYRKVCQEARRLLECVSFIKQRDWRETLELADQSCFVYLDPPYYGTTANYQNIDHYALIDTLNAADYLWAVSGYRSDLYDGRLRFSCRFERERNSEIKSSNRGKRVSVVETLWTNYKL